MTFPIRLGLACLLPASVWAAAPDASFFLTSKPAARMYREGWVDSNKNGTRDPYEDPALDVERRIDDLLSRMTLEEKTAQMVTLYGYPRVVKDDLPTAAWKMALWKDGIGNIDEHMNGNRNKGWQTKPLVRSEHNLPFSRHVRAMNEVQRFFVEETRLGVPAEFTNEGIRGLCYTHATSFPAEIAVGSTWNRALVGEIGGVTAREGRALAYTNIYSPVIDLPRDPRWGRTPEAYSEDPFLSGELAYAQVRGIQSQRVVSSPKHFAVYGIPKGGRDDDARTDPHATWSEVQTVHLHPFRRAIRDAGALGVMASYNDYDGVPVEGSRLFLTEILREEWGFRGYVVSDSAAVEFIQRKHRVAGSYAEAIRQSVEAGLNIRTNFTMPEYYAEPLRQLVRDGRLSMQTIDSRVRDILRVKYWAGLFDAPYRVPAEAERIVGSPAHAAAASRAARESIVLLKNDGLLPLEKDVKTVLVVGPLADDQEAWWNRYGPQDLEYVTTLAGLRKKLGPGVEVRHVPGVAVADANYPESDVYKDPPSAEVRAGIDAAVAAARGVDVIIATLGETEEQCRESRSRVSLNLPGYQEELLQAVHATGVPVVLVLTNGRPLSVNWAVRKVPAIVEAWFPGREGGEAIADVLFGDYNPAGRLPITMPKTVGQIPYNFPAKPGSQGRDRGQVEGPLYPFGHGLSYTTFTYSNLKVTPERIGTRGSVQVAVDVKNTGTRAGDEVVQLYVRDDVSSVTTFDQNLRGFERVPIPAGETRTVTFTLGPEHLQLFDAHRQWTVEPGRFTVMVGASSADIRLTGSFAVTRPDGTVPAEDTTPPPER